MNWQIRLMYFIYCPHSQGATLMDVINHWTYCIWPLTGKHTLTTFQEMGFSHGSPVGCTRLEKSSETDWQSMPNQMGSQKSLTSGWKFYTAWKKIFMSESTTHFRCYDFTGWCKQLLKKLNYGLIHYRKKSGFLFQNQTEQWFCKVNKCTRMMGVYYIKC